MEMVALSLTLKDGEMDSQGEEAMVLDAKAGKGVEGDQSDLPEPNKVYKGRSICQLVPGLVSGTLTSSAYFHEAGMC